MGIKKMNYIYLQFKEHYTVITKWKGDLYKAKPRPRYCLTIKQMRSSLVSRRLAAEVKLADRNCYNEVVQLLVSSLDSEHTTYCISKQLHSLLDCGRPRCSVDINRSTVTTLCTEIGLIGPSAPASTVQPEL